MKLTKLIKKGKTSKSIFLLMSGSILGQLITLICSPFVTRIYSPTEMGDYTIIITIVTLFSVVINGRYDAAIVSAKDDDEAISLAIISFIFAFILSIIITFGSLVYLRYYGDYKAINTKLMIWVFPLLLIYGITNVLNGYNNRKQEFRIMSDVYVIRIGAQNIITIVLGLLRFEALGLLIGQLLGNIFGIRRQSKILISNLNKYKQNQWENIAKTLCLYKDQLVYSVPASFTNSLSYSLINFLIGGLFGTYLLGLYSISYRVLGLPLGIFSTNIAKVYYVNASAEKEKEGTFWQSTKQTLVVAFLIAVMMVVFLILLAPTVFAVVFGDHWREAGEYVRILSPMFGLRLIVGSIGFNFIIAKKQKTEFIVQTLLLLALICSYILTNALSLNIDSFLLLISVLYSLIYLFEIFIMVYYSRVKE